MFYETRKYTAEEIARWFSIPEHLEIPHWSYTRKDEPEEKKPGNAPELFQLTSFNDWLQSLYSQEGISGT